MTARTRKSPRTTPGAASRCTLRPGSRQCVFTPGHGGPCRPESSGPKGTALSAILHGRVAAPDPGTGALAGPASMTAQAFVDALLAPSMSPAQQARAGAFRASDEVEELTEKAAENRADRDCADEHIREAIRDMRIHDGVVGQVVIDALEAAVCRLKAEARARKAGR